MRASETSRWYGGLIAVVAGLYAIAVAAWGPGMSYLDWFLLVLGGVVLGHGLALLAGVSVRLHDASGAPMAVYALLMLVSQAWIGTQRDTWLLSGTMNYPAVHRDLGWTTLTWDPGLVALAVLLFASGALLVATRRW